MNRFDYVRAGSIAQAIAAAAQPGAAYLGGGTNLLDVMKGGIARPSRLVDITGLTDLNRIETLPDGGLRIGALVPNSDLARHPAIVRHIPMLAEALLAGASAQLRNAATTAGNILQRTRCPYFYDTASACNKRTPGAGCAAVGGATRLHAIVGWSSHCIATHPSDLCVALATLDAVVDIEGPAGRRAVPFNDFHRLPGDTPQHDTVLAQGDLIVALRLPPEAAGFAAHASYLKIRDRTSYAFAVVSAAAALRLEGGVIVAARLALGGVAAKPWRAHAAEACLLGQAPNAENFRAAAAAALEGARPSGDNAFKIGLAQRVAARAYARAAAGTPDRMPALPASVFAQDPGVLVHA